MTSVQFQVLAKYSACDVSDALLRLEVPGAGLLDGITPVSPDPFSLPEPYKPRTVAPASTVLFAPKASASFPNATADANTTPEIESNIPAGTPYADMVVQDTIVVIAQPDTTSCAVVGGINATRMKKLGTKGVVVSGRVRDLGVLRGLDTRGWHVWCRGNSTVGAGAETKAWAMDVPIEVGRNGVVVAPGDIILLDPAENGAVCIPKRLLGRVLELLPVLTSQDEKVMIEVRRGDTVEEAFQKHRIF
ncbi:DlpA domain-containing protein [Saccharata proteae CBS 121410]|uniref:DlpA domain-containing protein n=1 Tax=Saccharata proteae CBS 121410 TaxID=1314787 RepID=A0A6A5YER5_9PEZI|nr:DlpA domain-containing protein [Saccharata proteae CBS 121410]